MVSGKGIDFWFAIGSTYTYLSVMRIGGIEQATGLEIRWRPFSLRTLTRELNNVPFATKPYKAKYMWRDIERRAQMDELPVRLPNSIPTEGVRPREPGRHVGRAGGLVSRLREGHIPALV